MAPDELRRRAVRRALANGGASAVRRLRLGVYEVESASRPGTVHRVGVDGQGVYHCSCEAALAGRLACWHRAAVYVARLEKNSGVRVTGPAVSPAPNEAFVPANVVLLRRAA
jgi:hypothetical protein